MPRPNQGKYLKQNDAGVWEIHWTEHGRSRRVSTGRTDYLDAQQVYAAAILGQGPRPPQRQIPTIDTILTWYEREKLPAAFGKATLRWNIRVLREHFGRILVTELTQADVDEFIADRRVGLVTYQSDDGQMRCGGPVALGTIRNNLQMLLTACNHAAKTKRIESKELPYFTLPPAAPARTKWLSREEAQRLLQAAQPDQAARLTPAYRFISTALFTATRRTVIAKLPWSRIDIAGRTINFQDPDRPPTKKRTGVIPISDEFLPIVQRAYDERETEWWLDTPVYPSRGFDKACAKAGLPEVSPHVLRHTWATWAAQDGLDLWTIAGVLHDTVATVEKHYAHQTTEHLRTAMNRTLLPTAPEGAPA